MNSPMETPLQSQKVDGVRPRSHARLKGLLLLLGACWLAAAAYVVSPLFAERLFGPIWSPPSTPPTVDELAGTYVDEDSSLTLHVDGSYEYISNKSLGDLDQEVGTWRFPKYVDSARLYLDLMPAQAASASTLVASDDYEFWYERGWFWRSRLGVGGDNDNARHLYRQD